jgi:hypothetical protein
MIDAGGYYHFKREGMQLLFAYGHSIAGQTENYGYLGMYWTWGKDDKKAAAGDIAPLSQLRRNAFSKPD